MVCSAHWYDLSISLATISHISSPTTKRSPKQLWLAKKWNQILSLLYRRVRRRLPSSTSVVELLSRRRRLAESSRSDDEPRVGPSLARRSLEGNTSKPRETKDKVPILYPFLRRPKREKKRQKEKVYESTRYLFPLVTNWFLCDMNFYTFQARLAENTQPLT